MFTQNHTADNTCNIMIEAAYVFFPTLLYLNYQNYYVHLGELLISDLLALFLFCSNIAGLVLNTAGRISNVIQVALSHELLAVKLKTLNAHMCTNKWRVREERCLYKRRSAMYFSCLCVNTACTW